MSQQALGIAGAVIGFYIGGPGGAQIGFIVGSTIGGVLFPEEIPGPRLNDIPIQTSRDGIPIPIGWGIIHTRGNIIQLNPLREEIREESAGKGGGATITSTHYFRTFAVGVCRSIDGPIAGIRRIWENDKLVYDARAHALYEYPNLFGWDEPGKDWDPLLVFLQQPPPWFNAWMWQDVDPATLKITPEEAARYAAQLMVYYGDEAQLPDSELEAHWGTDWTPAFKGLSYIVWNNYDLTNFGASIPQYRFEVLVNGTGIITSRVYPLEVIDQIKLGCSAPFGSMSPVPITLVDEHFDLINVSMRSALRTQDVDRVDVDENFDLLNVTLRQVLRTHDVGGDQVDENFGLLNIDLRPALVTQTVPPEGLQIGISAPTGSMTAV